MSENFHLGKTLTNDKKKNIIEAIKNDDLILFISYILGNEDILPCDIFEEISEEGNNWTAFHYAMHYGKWEIIKFIFDYLIDSNLIQKALKIKTNQNNCPLLCLLKSNEINDKQKKDIYFKILNTFPIQINDEVLKEAIERNFYNNNQNESNQKNSEQNKSNQNKSIQNESLLNNELSKEEKMNFYNSVIDGNLDLFKSYLNGTPDRKPYDIFEEVSAPGYHWTVFHYAMHYGKWEIIKFIFDYLINLDMLDFALKLKTNDNRCPFLNLLKSNDLDNEQKKDIYFKIINTFNIPVGDEVLKEAIERNFYDNNQNESNQNKSEQNESNQKNSEQNKSNQNKSIQKESL